MELNQLGLLTPVRLNRPLFLLHLLPLLHSNFELAHYESEDAILLNMQLIMANVCAMQDTDDPAQNWMTKVYIMNACPAGLENFALLNLLVPYLFKILLATHVLPTWKSRM
jgi:hypothetical protein